MIDWLARFLCRRFGIGLLTFLTFVLTNVATFQQAIAIEPDFPRSKKRQFVAGGLAGELVLNEKGWFGNTTKKVLHAGEGPILTIKWRGIFIAWANDIGVKLFDTSTQQRISYIDRPKGSPRPDMYVYSAN